MNSIIKRLWYWLRCHLWTRYHVINISGQDDYKWGWIETDTAILLSCFKLLVDFVEKQDPLIGLRDENWYRGEDCDKKEWEEVHRPFVSAQLEHARQVRALYDYWTSQRPADKKKIDEVWEQVPLPRLEGNRLKIVTNKAREEYYRLVEKFETKEQEMLHRLINVRRGLWT